MGGVTASHMRPRSSDLRQRETPSLLRPRQWSCFQGSVNSIDVRETSNKEQTLYRSMGVTHETKRPDACTTFVYSSHFVRPRSSRVTQGDEACARRLIGLSVRRSKSTLVWNALHRLEGKDVRRLVVLNGQEGIVNDTIDCCRCEV